MAVWWSHARSGNIPIFAAAVSSRNGDVSRQRGRAQYARALQHGEQPELRTTGVQSVARLLNEAAHSIARWRIRIEGKRRTAHGEEIAGKLRCLLRFGHRGIEFFVVVGVQAVIFHRIEPAPAASQSGVAVSDQPPESTDDTVIPAWRRTARPEQRGPGRMEHGAIRGGYHRHRRLARILALQLGQVRLRFAPGVGRPHSWTGGGAGCAPGARLVQGTSTPSRRISSANSLADAR